MKVEKAVSVLGGVLLHSPAGLAERGPRAVPACAYATATSTIILLQYNIVTMSSHIIIID